MVNRAYNSPELGKLRKQQAILEALVEAIERKVNADEIDADLAKLLMESAESLSRISERKSRIESNNVLTAFKVVELKKAMVAVLLLAPEDIREKQFEALEKSVLGELVEPPQLTQ